MSRQQPPTRSAPLFEDHAPASVPPSVAAAAGLPTPTLDPWIALSQPFPLQYVEVKPGAISAEKRRCLALADAGIDLSRRCAYLARSVSLCEALHEEQLIAVGKCATGK